MIATAGVVMKAGKLAHYYGRRSYPLRFSRFAATAGVVLSRITIYPLASGGVLKG